MPARSADAMLLKNVRPMGAKATDLLIEDGLIRRIEIDLPVSPGIRVEQCNGEMLLPGFVDAHTHLDKTFWGLPWQRHQAGPRLIDRIENERELRRTMKLSVREQAGNQIRQSLSMGTTVIRTHVDVEPELGLENLHGVLAAREDFKDELVMQTVAFPQTGLMTRPGTAQLLADAIEQGGDLIGGIDPCGIDRDPVGHLDTIFGIAERSGAGLDIHLHEAGELGAFSLELIAERTRALGMQGKVTVSHAWCLGMVGADRLEGLLDLLVENRIAIMTHAPGHTAFPPIQRLLEAGIDICSGSDGVRDAWGPYGRADMLERAMMLGYRSNFRNDEQLEAMLGIVTAGGAKIMGVDNRAIVPGARADLVLVDAETPAQAVVTFPPRKLVISNGRIVARDGAYLESRNEV